MDNQSDNQAETKPKINIPQPRVVFYMNSQPVNYYDHVAPPQPNSIFRPNYSMMPWNKNSSPTPQHSSFHRIPSPLASSPMSHSSGSNQKPTVQPNPDQKLADRSIQETTDDHNRFHPKKKMKSETSSFDSDDSSYQIVTDDEEIEKELNDEVKNFNRNQSSMSRTSDSGSSNVSSCRISPLTLNAKKNELLYKSVENTTDEISARLVYHSNMARQYPGAENRTPEQAEHRKKNSLAARISRAKSKVIEEKREQEAFRAKTENVRSKRTIAALYVYANELLKLLRRDEVDWLAKWKTKCEEKKREN